MTLVMAQRWAQVAWIKTKENYVTPEGNKIQSVGGKPFSLVAKYLWEGD